ncbi:MAG: D-glycero-beta-D-manno-heptose-7-phosphate kinase [bacterium]
MMKAKKIEKFRRLAKKFGKRRILVVGDVMLDEYVWGKATRISPEAPVPVVEIERRTFHPGGAANTVANIAALGASATLMGAVGKDENGKILRNVLRDAGIRPDSLVTDPSRPTTCKVRIIAHGQQVMRADYEVTDNLNEKVSAKILKIASGIMPSIHGIAVSDYRKGVINPFLINGLITLAKEHDRIIVVDMKPENAPLFKGITLATPNKSEASLISGVEIKDRESLREAGEIIRKELSAAGVLVTLGEDGMALFSNRKDMVLFPAVATQVYDVTGAGDTVISAVTLALSSGAALEDAVEFANFAAGVVVRKRGTTTAAADEILSFMESTWS